MKNHMRINGQLFQTNKKWSHLKEKQKTWIMETAWQEYDRFARERGKLPVHGSKQQLIEHIYEVIEAKGGIPLRRSQAGAVRADRPSEPAGRHGRCFGQTRNTCVSDSGKQAVTWQTMSARARKTPDPSYHVLSTLAFWH